MKIYIDMDELYPFYYYSRKRVWSGQRERGIDKNDLEYIKDAFTRFNKAQEMLKNSWKANNKRKEIE